MSTELQTTNKKKKPWLGLVLTTILTILVTVGVAWFQIARTENQAHQAELERNTYVENTLVAIVEEHVINEEMLDVSRMVRLIDTLRRENNVTLPITFLQVVEKSELNILNSRYLDFEKKKSFKLVFDSIYSEYNSREYTPIPNISNTEIVNELAKSIQDGKSTEAIEQLNRLIEAYETDLAELKVLQDRIYKTSILTEFIENKPLYLIIFVIVYVALGIAMMPRIRRIMKRYYELKRRREEELKY